MIGDFLGAVGHNEVRPVPSLDMHEAEVGLSAVIDPYSRGEVFLSFNKEGVSVEEAFVTFLSLPWQTQAKGGKFGSGIERISMAYLRRRQETERIKPMRILEIEAGTDAVIGWTMIHGSCAGSH